MKKILVAMSGGVDSSVAVALLLKQGYEVSGATMKLYDNKDIGLEGDKTCCSLTDIEDARSAAYTMGITHHVFNFSDQFNKEVIDKFVSSYVDGRTPNPCIDCNRELKFGAFLRRAELLGFDRIATGHYAISEFDSASGRHLLKKSVDRDKDQTYVLYGMTPEQLSKTVFPLGALDKNEVRKIAAELSLINAAKPDSQDICFVKDGDYARFIESYSGITPKGGNFIDKDGKVLGRHNGIIHYTVGQRKGLGFGLGKKMYVVSKDKDTDNIVLGENDQLYTTRLIAADVNLISIDKLDYSMKVQAKVRYSHTEESAIINPLEDGRVLVEFEISQRAVTPGQAVVFYDGDIVVGGGTIV